MSKNTLPPFRIDPAMSAKENLMAMINRDNGTATAVDQLTFFLPLDYDDPFDKNSRNTMVTVTGEPDSEYPGSFTFKYWRQSLDRIGDGHVVDLDQMEAAGFPTDTLDQIKMYLCQQLELIEEEVYFTTSSIPEFDWEHPSHELLLASKLNSYVYKHSMKVVLVRDTRTDLDDIFGPGDGEDGVVIIP